MEKYERHWNEYPAFIISVHGTSDAMVPYENSLFLQTQFPKKQFVLKSFDGVGHLLIWLHEQLIKNELLKLSY